MVIKNFLLKMINNRWIYFRKALIFQTDKEKEPFNLKEYDNSFELIFPAELKDIPDIEEISNISPSWSKQFSDRLKNTDYNLLLIIKDKNLAYFSWVSLMNEIDKYVHFNSHSFSKEPYLFHCYTFSFFRGKGLHTFATSYLMKYYLIQRKLIWGIIYSDNKAAIKAWKKAGMRKQGIINSFGFLKFKKSVIRKTYFK